MNNITVEQAIKTALAYHQAGNLAEAESLCRQVLAVQTRNRDALNLLGIIAIQTGNSGAAIGLFSQAITIIGGDPALHSNLGEAYRAVGNYQEAIRCYKRALTLRPDYPEAHNNLGEAYRGLGRQDEAQDCYEQALAIWPDYPEAHNNLGIVLDSKGQSDNAIACFEKALALRPTYAEAYNNLGKIFWDQGRLTEALAAGREAARAQTDAPSRLSNVIFHLQFHPQYDAQAIYAEHREWAMRHEQPRRQFIRPHPNIPAPNRRLNVGYVSADMRRHPVGLFLIPLLGHHDHSRYNITCYADITSPDAVTEKLRAFSDQWRETTGLSEEQMDVTIREDCIDILVDLSLHMPGNRLPVFARKPAPVQVSFAGYPSTTGLDAIDYRLSDPFLEPPGLATPYSSEQVVRLPDSFWLFDPPEAGPEVSPLPALDRGVITFGCLGNFTKTNDKVLFLWARVLNAVPGSRLVLQIIKSSQRDRTRQTLQEMGVDGERVEFVGRYARLDYFALYQKIDIILDTFPYNGHNTSLDALWMGVPVVSLVRQTAVGRGGLSILSNLGLPELAAQTEEEYVRIAVELTNDLPRLAALRATMRDRMRASPLMDAPRFARNVEDAYRTMWKTWCENQATSGSSVAGP